METKNRWYRHGAALLDEIDRADGTVRIWFMGQHGFVIGLGGLVFYIDVILGALRTGDGPDIRAYPPPFGPEAARRVDYYISTHNHLDHLNMETILPLAGANPQTRFIVPMPCRSALANAGIAESRLLGARAGEPLKVSAAGTIIPVPAVHTRSIQEQGETDENGDYTCLGFVIKSGGVSVYHAGDTWITAGLVETLQRLGPLNIGLLPINGTDWERTAGGCIGNAGVMDAVKLAMAVPIDLTIPAHYDMVPGNTENPAHFADCMYRLCPEKRFHICALGECFVYNE
jgi:L-ascorbate metabolism protein UlaG (beta-lactamase superfamily)